ncbi:hypothetical protein AK812_SmicGene6769 [Symbiodinium microadriaticum]|uniref:Uncharacterized protein n=1 Tax=Symbiodinium microadriaticum TaxID=2951 RepID=A0A1Q9EQ79_SYMMI|nr:hypothetical protein AK812_SmicGene6769 [Symbiodinium microadriaticum]
MGGLGFYSTAVAVTEFPSSSIAGLVQGLTELREEEASSDPPRLVTALPSQHDAEFLQYKDDGYGGDTKYHPWRYPGQLDPPPGFETGVDGSDFKVLPSLLEQTVWKPGSEALTEECFQRKPLEFVGDKQWLQFGNGFDKSNRLEIKAKRVGGECPGWHFCRIPLLKAVNPQPQAS